MSKKILLLFCLFALVILQFHNWSVFPVGRGFDATAHIKYIQFIHTYHQVPFASDGWEMYQPPLYYVIASLLPNLKLVQLMGIGAWLILVILSWIFFRSLFQEKNVALLGTVLLASYPVILYLTPSIGNEFFSGVIIFLTFIFYIQVFVVACEKNQRFTKKNFDFLLRPTAPKQQIILGLLISLSLLSKATALLVIPVILFDQCFVSKIGKGSASRKIYLLIQQLLLVTLTVCLFAGWFYVRNWLVYGNALYSTADYIPLYMYAQPVVPRDLTFFTTLQGFFHFDLFSAQYYSFLAGTYFSWFYDGHTVLLPIQTLPKIGVAIILLSFPYVAFFIWGMQNEVRKHWNTSTATRVFFLYTLLLFAGYIAYNFKLPFYSTVKASFIMTFALPFTYFLLKGVEQLPIYIKKWVPVYVTLYVFFIIKHFWILEWWYRR